MADRFLLILIKPSRYDDDGYVVQWHRSVYPSNALTVVNALAEECAERRVLGEGVEIVVEAYDDQCAMPSVEQFAARMKAARAGALACFVGIHTAQFPRAADLARRFRAADIPVAMGGFHVSGVLAMLPEPTPELQEMLDLGVTLFAGEAEGRFEQLLKDAHAGSLPPLYNHLDDLVDLAAAPPATHLPEQVERKLAHSLNPIDPIEAGRGCPFKCTFCTVINVHGRKPRMRSGETMAAVIRHAVQRGRKRFFFTDDNLSRNKNWREIFTALARLREEEGLAFTMALSVDTQSDNDPDFIPMAVRAGAVQVFVGMESVNPDALELVGKKHNAVKRYQRFFLEWKRHGVVTMAGYIIGFPNDTPQSVRRDLKLIQDELAVDILYPFILTPLPGSADHAALWNQGVPLDPNLSRYTSCHATQPHPTMSGAELEALFAETWKIFYSTEHVARMLRRQATLGGDMDALAEFILGVGATYGIEKVHPFETGLFRIKRRDERDPAKPREAALPFYLRRGVEFTVAQLRWGWHILRLQRMTRAAERHRGQPPDPDDKALLGYDHIPK
ncbi:B12-binding domain-containing radical SAM protein [Endothiovibrio diazotrophicus]